MHEDDLPPALDWEAPVWTLFARVATQWRYSFGGREGLDYGPAIKLIEARGWGLDRALDLLHAIEAEIAEWERDERSGQPGQG